ncbi:MAG: hypothetical protein K6B28_01040 [Lachnospiraceae bacterium]|nr:hypothetical protein [Lachnospiraceae bacterium]
MRKETLSYIKNIVKKESFHIDLVSVLLAGLICISTAVVLLNDSLMNLIKYIFVMAFILSALNAYKGYKNNAPTKFMYFIFAVITLILVILCIIVL